MDRKKVYIIIIVVCFVITAGVLYYGFFSAPDGGTPANLSPAAGLDGASGGASSGGASSGQPSASRSLPAIDAATEYIPPSVFPQDTTLDLSVFSSAKFRNLQDYAPLTVSEEEIGRENPFLQYNGN